CSSISWHPRPFPLFRRGLGPNLEKSTEVVFPRVVALIARDCVGGSRSPDVQTRPPRVITPDHLGGSRSPDVQTRSPHMITRDHVGGWYGPATSLTNQTGDIVDSRSSSWPGRPAR